MKQPLAVLLSAPLIWLLWAIAGDASDGGSRLGPDPVDAVVRFLGEWSLRLLLVTLCLSTSARLLRQPGLIRARRMTGLIAFTYVVLHFLAYLGFLAEFDWRLIREDLTDRRYITVGFLALVGLLPLAITSTRGWQRRLGRRWRQLHQLIYVVVPLGLLHLFWLTKDGFGEAVLYLSVFSLLMAERWLAARRMATRRSERA